MNWKSSVVAFYLCPKIFVLIFISLIALYCFVVPPRSVSVKAQQEEIAPTVTGYTENFDAVTAPQLPPNWTTAVTGTQNLPFVTSATTPNSPPNAAFTNDPATAGTSELVSPTIRVGGTIGGVSPKLIFRNFYDAESNFDGGVLEIKIGGGAFQDILTAGGSFVTGGYNSTLSTSFGNPLGGRRAWSGTSGGYITTEINLPTAAHRQLVQFKWRFGTDSSVADVGWRIDNIQVTNTVSGENLNAISIPSSGASSPYPSEISISEHDGLITGVQVNLQNFSHSSPDDVDLLLVSPGGRKVVLMSDVGGNNPVSNLALTFDDTANSLPDSAAITSGSYKPTNFEPGDAFPAPAPTGATTGNLLSAFNGDTANGVWKLFLVDDNGENAGTISGGWSIAVQTAPDVITIPASGAAQPYPTELFISGLPGSVTKATVTLSNFSHTAPDDVDILLVAPNGRRIVLMSDAGGGTETGGLNLTFDDAAGGSLPDNSPLVSGTFKPTDFETGDAFPAPAPAGAVTGATLNAFYGSPPNGLWKLFVVDDTGGESVGSIAGNWSLDLQTSTSACLFTISPETQAFPIGGGTGSFNITMPAGCSWTASSSAAFLGITSEASGEGNGMISFSVAPNMGGGRTATIDVTNGFLTRSFQVQQPSGCPFAVAQSSVSFGAAGGAGNVAVTAGSGCLWQASTAANWIETTSAPQTGDGAVTFNVQPNASANARSGVINLGLHTITVNQAGASGRRFDFDGDGRADVSVFRPSSGVWWILNSGQPGSYGAAQFGLATDKITPADYDGDRKTDLAVFREGVWYIFQSQDATVRIQHWGLAADVPVAADYDGDGRADLAVFRPSEGIWYVSRSSDSQYQAVNFGLSTDKPAPGDYDGDGRADFAVYRAGETQGAQSFWAILQSSNGAASMQQFGSGGDIPVPADYDGDGRDSPAVFRPSNGFWYTSTNPATNYDARHWGMAGDIPVTADYNGDGRADLAVFRQGIWYILHLGTEEIRVESWGLFDDKPAPAAYLPQ